MRELDRVNKTFNMYPDHNLVKSARNDMTMAACPDCESEVFTIRIIERKGTFRKKPYHYFRTFADCIYCGHQLILGQHDYLEEVSQ